MFAKFNCMTSTKKSLKLILLYYASVIFFCQMLRKVVSFISFNLAVIFFLKWHGNAKIPTRNQIIIFKIFLIKNINYSYILMTKKFNIFNV